MRPSSNIAPLRAHFKVETQIKEEIIYTKKGLRLIYDNYELTLEELLEKHRSPIIYHCNTQTLCIELYKVHHYLSQTIFSGLFTRNNSSYNLRLKADFVILQV